MWKRFVGPDQWALAGTVAAGMNDNFATWFDAHEIFDALQPKEAQLFGSEVTNETGDVISRPEPGGLEAARRVFESRMIGERTNLLLVWPVDRSDGAILGYTAKASVLIAIWRLFGGGGWRLIKRCHACTRWTVIAGDASYKRFCSGPCRTRWWNAQRARRRAATKTDTRRPRARRRGSR